MKKKKKDNSVESIIPLIIVGFLFIMISNPFETWETCNEKGANLEHTTFGKMCIKRTPHGCTGTPGGYGCEEGRAEECLEQPDSQRWYCNLDEQGRYYPLEEVKE